MQRGGSDNNPFLGGVDIGAHLRENVQDDLISLGTVQVETIECNRSRAKGSRDKIKRRMAPVAFHLDLSGRTGDLAPGNEKTIILPDGLNAKHGLNVPGQIDVSATFQRRCKDDGAVLTEQRESQQESGNEL